MGREVKRVALNFNWFEKTKDTDHISKIWFGYLIEVAVPCQLCDEGKIGEDYCRLCWGDKYVGFTIEPPEGVGWQMWEDTSEGSPISPVFKTAEELAQWLEDNGAPKSGTSPPTAPAFSLILVANNNCLK